MDFATQKQKELEQQVAAWLASQSTQAPTPAPAPLAPLRPEAMDVSGRVPPALLAGTGGTPPPLAPADLPPRPPPAPLDDAGLMAAQGAAAQQRLIAGIGRAGSTLAGAFSPRSRVDNSQWDAMDANADQPVKDYVAQKTARGDAAKAAELAALKDPTSAQSKAFQARVAKMLPGFYSPEDLAQLAAADADQVLQYGQIRGTLDERKQAHADKATELAQGKDLALRGISSHEKIARENNATELEKARLALGGKDNTKTFEHTSGLRKELMGSPVYKAAQESVTSNRQIQKVLSGTPSPAGDMAGVFLFMKTMDPGSSVREGEYANAQNAAGVPERVRNAYNRAIAGELLSPGQREDFKKQSASLAGVRAAAYRQLADQYKSEATKAGLDPSGVDFGLGVEDEPGSGGGAAPVASKARQDPEAAEALKWAQARLKTAPDDPDAQAILKRLGGG